MKSDKELAVEIVCAIIKANPRMTLRNKIGEDHAVPAIDQKGIDNLLEYYTVKLGKLENGTSKE